MDPTSIAIFSACAAFIFLVCYIFNNPNNFKKWMNMKSNY